MLGVISSDDRLTSTIVSDRGIKEIFDFLRARGIRAKKSTTATDARGRMRKGYISFPELAHLNYGKNAFYTVRGDTAFIAQRDIKVKITHDAFDLAKGGVRTLQSLLYLPGDQHLNDTFKNILEVIGVPCETIVGGKGRGAR